MPVSSDPSPSDFRATSALHADIGARLPAAAYLRYRSRADGWSAGRQAAFLAHLADNGLVADAARSVGMSLAGGYALRRTARGYAFHLGWEAAVLIARRIIADNLMTAAIRGEEARWVREDGVTSYVRQNTKLSLTLLGRINPASAPSEVTAVATRFDLFLLMIEDGLGAAQLWDYFFDEALPHSDIEARDRVRAALQLCEESADFEEDNSAADGSSGDNGGDKGSDKGGGEAPIEYKSMDAPRCLPFAGGAGPLFHAQQRGRADNGAQFDAGRFAAAQLKPHLARMEIERDAPECLHQVGAQQHRRFFRQAEHRKGRHVGKGNRHIAQDHRAQLDLPDDGHFQHDRLACDTGDFDLVQLCPAAPHDQVAQRHIADGDFRSGVDNRVDRQAIGLCLGQDQLPLLAPRGHDDFAVPALRRLAAVLNRDRALFKIEHQPLVIERIDAQHAVAAQIGFGQNGHFQIIGAGRAQPQLIHRHTRDDAAAGHAVQRDRAGRR